MKTINLLGVEIAVKETDVVNKYEPRKGEYDYLTATITLDKNMTVSMKNNTLMHELLHAMFDLLGYDDLRDDEQKVQAIASALSELFQQEVFFKNDSERDV
jgi:Zn-dependent peptidase ImmA (M78 family)